MRKNIISLLCGCALVGLLGPVAVWAQDGSIVGWGSQVVVPQSDLTDLVTVAGGRHHSLALKADGSIVAWGSNISGQSDLPAPNRNFIAVSAGTYLTLGLKSDGSIQAWGTNVFGQLNVPEPKINACKCVKQYLSLLGSLW